MNRRTATSLQLIAGTLLIGFFGCEGLRRTANIITYSDSGLLRYSWDDYKRRNVQGRTGRVINHEADTTTSEGQSYAMLRAVWIDDREEFDRSWCWTRENLQHPHNHLFAWLYGRLSDGSLGVLYQQGGATSATDADTDIALALILAYSRWHDRTYLDQAQEIVGDIWRLEVVTVRGTPYVVADDTEGNAQRFAVMNPSYFEPYAYRLFAKIDREHPWLEVVRSSYDVLGRTLASPLNVSSSAGLPPDWVVLDRLTGDVKASTDPHQSSNFGFDAFRVPWRMAVDWQWNHSADAYAMLNRMSELSVLWKRDGRLAATYGHDGTTRASFENRAMYGATLGYFLVMDPPTAETIYQRQVASWFHHSTRSWEQGYYDENWLWFGTALKQGQVSDFDAAHKL